MAEVYAPDDVTVVEDDAGCVRGYLIERNEDHRQRWLIYRCKDCGAEGLNREPMVHYECESLRRCHEALSRGEQQPGFPIEVIQVVADA